MQLELALRGGGSPGKGGRGKGDFGGGKGMKLAMGMHFSVICAEDAPRIGQATDAPGTDFGRVDAEMYARACRDWPRGEVPPEFYKVPPAPSDLPLAAARAAAAVVAAVVVAAAAMRPKRMASGQPSILRQRSRRRSRTAPTWSVRASR